MTGHPAVQAVAPGLNPGGIWRRLTTGDVVLAEGPCTSAVETADHDAQTAAEWVHTHPGASLSLAIYDGDTGELLGVAASDSPDVVVAPRAGQWTPIGPRQEVSPERHASTHARGQDLFETALMTRAHLWTAAMAYHITVPLVEGLQLDLENLISGPTVGCIVCEQQYQPGAEDTDCPGLAPGA